MHYVGLSLPNFVSDTLASYIVHAAEKANLSIVDVGSNAAAVAESHGLDLGRIVADGFESPRRLVIIVEYGKTALIMSLRLYPHLTAYTSTIQSLAKSLMPISQSVRCKIGRS